MMISMDPIIKEEQEETAVDPAGMYMNQLSKNNTKENSYCY